MTSHHAIQLAIRGRLLELVVCTTGSTTLGSSGSTYTRTAGSFLDDGFAPGMEVEASGFGGTRDGLAIVTAVSALVLTVDRQLGAAAAASGRELEVGLPSRRAWENTDFTPEKGKPHVVEQYIPGPARQVGAGPNGQVELSPMYAVHIHVPANVGIGASSKYAGAILDLFPMRQYVAVGDDVLRVRADTGPFPGQLMRGAPGWVFVPATIPFRLQTANSI